ncbi:unnamed protein product [Soboliphyme baturini]|uniref:BPI2 domain-containing protein n=1 Tax=Soboliphyme baturini TaxID=241478 RepID=A0A183IJ69_9BILA|nr:unnamed protein product [Soboliphyme baturini]
MLSAPHQMKAVTDKVSNFTIDMKMVCPMQYRHDDALVAFAGRFLYHGNDSPLQSHVTFVPRTSKMFAVAITDILPNSFLYHVYLADLASVEINLNGSQVPNSLKIPLRLICWGCRARLQASLSKVPVVSISKNNIRIKAEGFVKIVAYGFLIRVNVLTAAINVDVRATVQFVDGRLQLETNLDSVGITIIKMPMRTILTNVLTPFLEDLLRGSAWPMVQEKLAKVLQESPVQIPTICGIQLVNTSIELIENCVIVASDIRYNVSNLIMKLQQSSEERRGITQPTDPQ